MLLVGEHRQDQENCTTKHAHCQKALGNGAIVRLEVEEHNLNGDQRYQSQTSAGWTPDRHEPILPSIRLQGHNKSRRSRYRLGGGEKVVDGSHAAAEHGCCLSVAESVAVGQEQNLLVRGIEVREGALEVHSSDVAAGGFASAAFAPSAVAEVAYNIDIQ